MNLIQTQPGRHCFSYLFLVAGEHDCPSDAYLFKILNCLKSLILDGIRYDNVSAVYAVQCHIDNRTHAHTLLIRHIHFFHQLAVAGQYGMTVYLRLNSMTGYFLCIADTVHINGISPGILDGTRNGMVRITLRQSRQLQQGALSLIRRLAGRPHPGPRYLRRLRDRTAGYRVNLSHLEFSLGQRTCLIKDNGIHLRQSLQIVASLDEHTLLGSSANA